MAKYYCNQCFDSNSPNSCFVPHCEARQKEGYPPIIKFCDCKRTDAHMWCDGRASRTNTDCYFSWKVKERSEKENVNKNYCCQCDRSDPCFKDNCVLKSYKDKKPGQWTSKDFADYANDYWENWKKEQTNMTRQEAIKKLSADCSYNEVFIEATIKRMEALGLIKFDEEKKDEYWDIGGYTISLTALRGIVQAHGYRIVKIGW